MIPLSKNTTYSTEILNFRWLNFYLLKKTTNNLSVRIKLLRNVDNEKNKHYIIWCFYTKFSCYWAFVSEKNTGKNVDSDSANELLKMLGMF